jgi:hypothetical protein
LESRMVKVVVANLGRSSKAGAKKADFSGSEKRVRNPEGQLKTLRTLDLGSRTFGNDLGYVFSKNVAKARRDNKRVTGSTDVAPAKR